MKSFTSFGQSKKLAEILPLESADMTLEQVAKSLTEDFEWKPRIGLDSAIKYNLYSYKNGYMLPRWSCVALLNALPQYVRLNGNPKDEFWYCECVTVDCNFNVCEHLGDSADNPIDACYKIIIMLNDLKLL